MVWICAKVGVHPFCSCHSREVKLHRKHYPVSDLIGHPYGTVFEVQGRHLVPVDEPLIPVDVADGRDFSINVSPS